METHLKKVAIATTIYLLEIFVSNNQAHASTLFIGRYGSLVQDINSVGFIPKTKLIEQITASPNNEIITLNKNNLAQETLISKIDALSSAEPLKEQIEQEYQSFKEEYNPDNSNFNPEQQNERLSKDLTGIANPEQINQNIEDRYQGLVETNSEKITLFEANQLVKEHLSSEITTSNQTQDILQNQDVLQEISSVENGLNSQKIEAKTNLFPTSWNVSILLAIFGGGCLVLVPIINAFGSLENENILDFLANIFGKPKPKVPDEVVSLHNKTFKQVANLARKISRMDDEKFTNQEFTLYLKLRNKIQQGARERESMCLSIKYLEVGIIAQSSFLQLEQTELRYLSRRQQDFYQFVADSITDDIDKNIFRDQIKQKLAEVLPLINTEEGRTALKGYLKEVEKISRHDLGLKLLSLFKKYQLADFNILRKVSDIVEQSTAESLITDENLKVVVLKNYDVLEKLAPIIEMSEEDMKPKFFTKVIQYLGLNRRHEKSFQQFQNLIKVLQQWEKTFNSLQVIRQQYPSNQYKTSKEFSKTIPGLNIHQKYQEYLNKN